MITIQEASKQTAAKLLAERESELATFGQRLIPEGSRLKRLAPIRLFLGGDISYASDGSVAGFYKPSLSVAYLTPNPNRPVSMDLVQADTPEEWSLLQAETPAKSGPAQLEIALYGVEVRREESLGLIAVSYTDHTTLDVDPGLALVPHIQIEDPVEQELLGQSFVLLALAHGLEPEGIA